MKRFHLFSTLLLLVASAVTWTACGPGKDRARFEGKLANISNAEFYAYTDDGSMQTVDTIRIVDGEFTYERQLTRPMLLTLLYPNFTQTYVVLEPGKTVKMKGDASKIGEASITGTDDNEMLTDFRQQHASGNARNASMAAADFVRSHASTWAAVALFKRYFVTVEHPDARQASGLLAELHKAQPSNSSVQRMWTQLRPALESGVGQTLPDLSASTLDGRTVRLADYRGKRLIVVLHASWRGQSVSFLRSLKRLLRESGMNEWECLVVSADIDVKQCRESLKSDTIQWPVVCDGRSFRSPLIERLGLKNVPSCMVVDRKGRITARDVTDIDELRRILRK